MAIIDKKIDIENEMKIHRYETDKIITLNRIMNSSLLDFFNYYLNGQSMIDTLYMRFMYEDVGPLDVINYYNIFRHEQDFFLNIDEQKLLDKIMSFVNYEINYYQLQNNLSYL